jgi:glucose/mannose-6-phosphate isomerase
LDDETTYTTFDPARMIDRIIEMPRQCRDAWTLVQDVALLDSHRGSKQVVILGMGGSAIGGALLAGLVSGECPASISFVGGYDLPAHVGPDALVITSSYSGNTAETLSAFAQAVQRECKLVAVTTGGKLGRLAEEQGIPLLQFAYDSPPRAALGYSFTLLLGLFCRLGLVDKEDHLLEAIAVMEDWQREVAPTIPTEENQAKLLAQQLHRRLPVVYGAGITAAVARRWKGQFNENSKNWTFWEELPELNHNAVVGYGLPKKIRKQAVVIFLRTPEDQSPIRARWEATQELLDQEGVGTAAAWGRGESALAQMFSLIHFGDMVSFYLAMLNQVDPTPVEPIERLKRRLERDNG